MFSVCRMVSTASPDRACTGFPNDLRQRHGNHPRGCNPTTAPFRPRRLTSYAAFEIERTARQFERYLKSGSGDTFALKRFWPNHIHPVDPPVHDACHNANRRGG